MQLTEEQKAEFLELVRDGKNRQQAAEELADRYERPDITASKLRNLCHREPAFDRLYQEAMIEGRGTLVERLERCANEMALGGHWQALRFLLTTYGEQFAWARTSKVEVAGTVEIQAIAGILSRYLPAEEYDKVIEAVEQRMIEAGDVTPAVDRAA